MRTLSLVASLSAANYVRIEYSFVFHYPEIITLIQ
jgi:hypothetical protein